MNKYLSFLVVLALLCLPSTAFASDTSFSDDTDTGDLVADGGFKVAYIFASPDVIANSVSIWDNVTIAGYPDTSAGQESDYYVMPTAGSVTGITVYSNVAITAGGLTVDATINDTRVGLTASLDTTNTQTNQSTQLKDKDTFTAGQRLGVDDNITAGFAPSGSADITVVVIVEHN